MNTGKFLKCFCLIVCVSFLFLACSDDDDDNNAADISVDTLSVGVIIPISGSGPLQKESEQAAVDIALEDVNKYFADNNIKKYINAEIRDSEFSSLVIQQALEEFNENNIRIVVFAGVSDNLFSVKSYIDDNGMLLINPTSTSVELSVDDNIYRLIPDDDYLSELMGDMLKENGVEKLVILSRGDIWGSGLGDSLKVSFEASGGSVESIYYDPRHTDEELEVSIQTVDSLVSLSLNTLDSNKIAVSYNCFEEGINLLKIASNYPSLEKVKWYGSDGFGQNQDLLSDTVASKFATKVGSYCPIIAEMSTSEYQGIKNRIAAKAGYEPYSWAMVLYDAFFVASLTRIDSDYDNTDIVKMKKALSKTLADYDAISGSIVLNENGDRASYNFEFWGVSFNNSVYSWTKSFTYPSN